MRLLINADDLGYCPKRNFGIFELLKENKISTSSLMVNVPKYSNEAAKNLAKFQKRIGLHFNITEDAVFRTYRTAWFSDR